MFKGMPVARIPKQFTRLNLLANFPESAVRMPTSVKSLDLVFKDDNKHGHMGAKKFWRNNLPTIQFHNPSLPITVTRVHASTDEESLKCPAQLTVSLENGETHKIDMKHRFYNDIMAELKEVTGAEPVPELEIPVLQR